MKNKIFKYTITICATVFIIGLTFFQGEAQTENNLIKKFNSSLNFEAEGDYKNALSELLSVYSQNKNHYLLNLRLGWVYYRLQDFEKSKVYYKTAVNINKQSVEAMIAYTLPLSALELWGEVEDMYKAVLKLDEKNYTANLRLGQIFLYRGDYKFAKQYLEKVYNCNPGAYEPNISLGWTYFYLGEKEKAAELFNNVLTISPHDSLATLGIESLK